MSTERYRCRCIHGHCPVCGAHACTEHDYPGRPAPQPAPPSVPLAELGAYTLSMRETLVAGGALVVRLRVVGGAGPISDAHVEEAIALLRGARALLTRGMAEEGPGA